MYLEHLEVSQFADQQLQIIVVGLELLLVKNLQSEGMKVRTQTLDKVEQHVEIVMLGQVLKHLLED